MKLHWSPRSPYVRKVMITANELGIADRLTCMRTVVSTFKPAEELFADNPLNKLPTLVLDDGSALFDSRVICEYFDSLHNGVKLYPSDPKTRFQTLRYQALGDGILDICLIRLGERLKPEEQRNAAVIASNERKASEAVSRLEAEADIIEARPFDIGHVAIGTALGYLDFRFVDDNWRAGRPKLSAWHDRFNARPAVLACPVSDDS